MDKKFPQGRNAHMHIFKCACPLVMHINNVFFMCMLSHSVCLTLCNTMGLWPIRHLCLWGFSRQEYWSGSPFLSPGDLSNPGIEPGSPAFQADSLPTELGWKPNVFFT